MVLTRPVREAIFGIASGLDPDRAAEQLVEFFGSPLGQIGSLLTAGEFAKHTVPGPYVPVHHRQEPYRAQNLAPKEKELFDVVSELFNMLQRAHLKANDFIEPLGIRYEIQDRNAIPDLRHISTTLPDLLTVTVELRDVWQLRRKTQFLRYRLGVGRTKNRISLRVMDSRTGMNPPRQLFKPGRDLVDFQVRNFEARLVPKLVERARSAFRR